MTLPAATAANVTHKYLWCWDRIMYSSYEWSATQQTLAQTENAPVDAIFRRNDGSWTRWSAVTSPHTRMLMNQAMITHFGVPIA